MFSVLLSFFGKGFTVQIVVTFLCMFWQPKLLCRSTDDWVWQTIRHGVNGCSSFHIFGKLKQCANFCYMFWLTRTIVGERGGWAGRTSRRGRNLIRAQLKISNIVQLTITIITLLHITDNFANAKVHKHEIQTHRLQNELKLFQIGLKFHIMHNNCKNSKKLINVANY